MESSLLKPLGGLSPAARLGAFQGAHGTDARCVIVARSKAAGWRTLLAVSSRRLLETRSRAASTPRKDVSRSLEMEVENETSASDADLRHFISQGPLVEKLGTSARNVEESIEDWRTLGAQLSRHLGFDELKLSESEKKRIFHYYVPIFLWCKEQLALHRSRWQDEGPAPPLVIGISAPQGCGKTTIVDSLEQLFNASGSPAAAISIDDFYLTGAEQTKLAEDNAGNKLLELRGNAGSHDVQLGSQTLNALLNLRSAGTKVKCPRYDKSARSGRGDRADPSTWPEMEGPLAVILFEGWMLGFEPLDEAAVAAVDPQLAIVNQRLHAYQQAWHSYVDSWIIVQVPDRSWIYQWRLEAEVAMRSGGKPGMTDEEVEDFVSRYIPAYEAYLPSLYRVGPKGAIPEKTFKFEINQDRNPVG